VIKNRFPLFLVAAVACSPVLAENAAEKPISESDLLKQIEAIKPAGATVSVTPTSPAANATVSPAPASNIIKLPGDKLTAGNGPDTPDNTDKKVANVTEITAIEATFDQKANVAVFLKDVVVKDPQFNVECDKLTAYLKHEDKEAAATPAEKGAAATPGKSTGKPTAKPAATPVATPTAAAATPIGKGGATAAATPVPKKKGSGLDKAVHVTTGGRPVKITQDKVEADGSITHGIGIADRAEYYSSTGDIFLYGSPDVTSGTNRCIATAPETWMKLNRDGRMEAHGPHRTFIVDNDRDNKQTNNATPAPTRRQ